MNIQIPLTLDFRAKLESLGHAGLQELAKASSVPFTTLWKIKTGETANPGIETVRAFAPHIAEVEKAAA
jgi:predicted transcriptional regulator